MPPCQGMTWMLSVTIVVYGTTKRLTTAESSLLKRKYFTYNINIFTDKINKKTSTLIFTTTSSTNATTTTTFLMENGHQLLSNYFDWDITSVLVYVCAMMCVCVCVCKWEWGWGYVCACVRARVCVHITKTTSTLAAVWGQLYSKTIFSKFIPVQLINGEKFIVRDSIPPSIIRPFQAFMAEIYFYRFVRTHFEKSVPNKILIGSSCWTSGRCCKQPKEPQIMIEYLRNKLRKNVI